MLNVSLKKSENSTIKKRSVATDKCVVDGGGSNVCEIGDKEKLFFLGGQQKKKKKVTPAFSQTKNFQ
jgi:hypothetical protein